MFDIGGDHEALQGMGDPATDYITWFNPLNRSAGSDGYFEAVSGSAGLGDEVFTDMVLVQAGGGWYPPYAVPMPEAGTVFRITIGAPPSPILASPAPDFMFVPGEISFYWSGLQFDSFQIQIARTPQFAFPMLEAGVDETELAVTIDEIGNYFWRVRGLTGDWSETGTFRVVESFADDPVEENPKLIDVSIYPNPVSSNGTILFDLFESRPVGVDVYDVLGRRVERLTSGPFDPGRYRFPIDGSRLASGVYFVRLNTGDVTETLKLVIAH